VYESQSDQTRINMQGHYVHNQKISPFANKHYANYSLGSKEAEQEAYMEKMTDVRKNFGAWNFYDDEERPVVDTYHEYPNRDVPVETFPDSCWQSDNAYVESFLDESLKLVERVREGIYQEYGGDDYDPEAISKIFGVNVFSYPNFPKKKGRLGTYTVEKKDYTDGIGWMTESGYEALVRKLLHAMMSNDDFYVVLAGHSAAAGHGNDFPQTKAMQFQYLMEPIFEKLGMNLITRNMAMGGLGTLHSSLGGSSIYGERDILIWDSSMTEKDAGAVDMFCRQALMSGDRVPIILGAEICTNLRKVLEGAGGFWTGSMTNVQDFFPYSDEADDINNLPYHTQGLQCKNDQDLCKEYKYNSKCWIDRTDFSPEKKQNEKPGGQANWHPGWRTHTWLSRRWSLLVLHALETALTTWKEEISSTGQPLADHHWHVGDRYDKIRAAVKEYRTDNSNGVCEDIFDFIPRVCKLSMTAATEFTPRADFEGSSIRKLLVPAPNGYIPHLLESDVHSLYNGPDLLQPETKIPDGTIDVHAIAIASVGESKLTRRLNGHKKLSKDGRDRQILRGMNLESNLVGVNSIRRSLSSIVPGQGWALMGHPSGFCDGSAQSECGRGRDSNCLMYGHNDGRGGIFGDSHSGWLVMRLNGVREGIILARIETWHHPEDLPKTNGWTSENNGKTNDETTYIFPGHQEEVNENETNERRLKSSPPPSTNDIHFGFDTDRILKKASPVMNKDFQFEIAIDGEIKSTWKTEDFEDGKQKHEIAYNMAYFVLMDDPSMSERFNGDDDDVGETVELAIRLSGQGSEVVFALSHLYWA